MIDELNISMTARKMKILVTFALALFLTGCSSLKDPRIAYENKESHSLEDTAVFSGFPTAPPALYAGQILSIDGKDLYSAWDGYPIWVRVKPGSHTFKVKSVYNQKFAGGAYSYNYAVLDIKIDDMQPEHIYRARYTHDSENVYAQVEDLGKNSGFTIFPGHSVKFSSGEKPTQ